jgi:hypothetical protein
MAGPTIETFRAAKEELSARLLQPSTRTRAQAARTVGPDPANNVVGVGIGEKLAAGRPTGVRSVTVLVRIKLPADQIEQRHMLPAAVGGLPVDVQEEGLVVARVPNPRTKLRPARPGSSCGFKDPGNQFRMAGTFGALATNATGLYVLSNNHVLADENQLPVGAPIFQPGLLDGGHAATDQVASLAKFVKLAKVNSVDCAIAKVLDPALVGPAVLQIGAPKGTKPAAVDMVVHKFGRTTSYTAGRITSVNTDVNVQYDQGVLTFKNQMVIRGLQGTNFSAAGDSGSLIVERSTRMGVGLLFAGGSTSTFANHLADVLSALGVTLVLAAGPSHPHPHPHPHAAAHPHPHPAPTPAPTPTPAPVRAEPARAPAAKAARKAAGKAPAKKAANRSARKAAGARKTSGSSATRASGARAPAKQAAGTKKAAPTS